MLVLRCRFSSPRWTVPTLKATKMLTCIYRYRSATSHNEIDWGVRIPTEVSKLTKAIVGQDSLGSKNSKLKFHRSPHVSGAYGF